jgi:hypothetical protein
MVGFVHSEHLGTLLALPRARDSGTADKDFNFFYRCEMDDEIAGPTIRTFRRERQESHPFVDVEQSPKKIKRSNERKQHVVFIEHKIAVLRRGCPMASEREIFPAVHFEFFSCSLGNLTMEATFCLFSTIS